jgi:CheY-like chemotaxis protein
VRIVAEQQQSLVRVSVIDDGVGIAADKQEKIFEPFHRAGQETGAIEGTGIGRERPPAPRPVVDLARFGESGPKLIVYVEDDPSNVAFMQDLLGDVDGVRLMVAPSAEVGIELIREHQPALVIMGINLPGLSGIEALRHLKERPETRDIPVVALSAAAMVGEAKRIKNAGFTRYLTKPVRVDELLEVLDELLS